MAEETTMQNLDMRHFTTVQTAADNDYVILNLGTGLAAKISVGLLKSLLTAKISPNIVDGVWHVGATSLDVSAEGKTPELRQGELGIEYKYTTEDDTAWRLLVPYTSIKLQYDMLTASQKNEMATLVSGQITEEVYTRVSEDVVEGFTETINTAVQGANTAAANANTAATETLKAKDEAVAAKEKADKAATNADTSAENANKAATNADTSAENANKAAEEANKYANRVKDITEAQWEEMEENKTWVEGVEYNVYESAEEEEVAEDEV